MFLFCTVFGPPRLQSACPTLFFTLITEGDQCHFSEVLNWNRLCAVSWSPRSSFRPLGLLQHQLRTEIGGRTPVRTSEPGGGHLAAGWECWICSVLVYIRPLLHLRLWDCCKDCRGVVGGATSLISLRSFWTTYISRPLIPSPPPHPHPYLSRRERLTYALLPVIALSSFGIYELALRELRKRISL